MKKAPRSNLEEERPEMVKIKKFEKIYPQGPLAFADYVNKTYHEMSRQLLNKYQLAQEILGGLKDRIDFRMGINTELNELKTQRGDKPIQDNNRYDDRPFVPEEFIPSEIPNLFQRVVAEVRDIKGTGITESLLDKMELDIISMYEASKEYIHWLLRLLISVKNEMKKARSYSLDLKDLISLLVNHISLDKMETPVNNSFSRDTMYAPTSVVIHAEGAIVNKIDIETLKDEVNNLPSFLKLFKDYRSFLCSMIMNDNLIKVFLNPYLVEQSLLETDRESTSKNIHINLFSNLRNQVRAKIRADMDSNLRVVKEVLLTLTKRIHEIIDMRSYHEQKELPRMKLYMVYDKFTDKLREAMAKKVDSFKQKHEVEQKLEGVDKKNETQQNLRSSDKFFKKSVIFAYFQEIQRKKEVANYDYILDFILSKKKEEIVQIIEYMT